MIIILCIISFICMFIIFYGMIGYPLLLLFIDKIKKTKENVKNNEYEPYVTYMIVAHNEQKVIKDKLKNALELDYPKEKFQIIIASDNSTDKTNEIVKDFIRTNLDRNINLYCSKEHKGKTNAQNEAQKIATGEILIMTDANTIIKPNAIKEIVSYYTSPDIVYVCGKLEYSNTNINATSQSEGTYWNLDLKMRNIESKIRTITAGNGALYSCRNDCYIDFEPISCHDSIMPYTYSKDGKRALFNPNAIAIEKAGESDEDEYKRKVRMNRDILTMIIWGLKVINPFKYKWFSFFYFGHRTCRYLLWMSHIVLLITSGVLALVGSRSWLVLFILQILFYLLSFIVIKMKVNNSILRLVGYYGMTILAQLNGVINIVTGKSKPIWEKAESTR